MSNYTIEVIENVVNLDVLKDHDIIIEIKSSDNFITFDTPSGYPILFTSGILPVSRVGSGYLIENLTSGNTIVRTFDDQAISGSKIFTGDIISSGNSSFKFQPTLLTPSYFPVLVSDPSTFSRNIYTRTSSQIKSDLALNNVQNIALSGVIFSAGSGLAGGGNLSSSRSFDVGQGDGLIVSADSIAVDSSTVVRSTNLDQSISGIKTFSSNSGVRFTASSGDGVYNNKKDILIKGNIGSLFNNTITITPTNNLYVDRTYYLPEAGADSDFVMTAGGQVITGPKTFTSPTIFNSGTFTSLRVGATGVALSGHTHNIADIISLQTTLDNKQPSGNYASSSHNHPSSNITDFNTSVSGLLPITLLTAGNGIGISAVGSNYTISTTGTFGLTQTQVDSRVNTLTNGVYAPLSSPTFTGTPLTPTASAGTNNTQIASTAFVRTEISNLVASAPTALDTLNELAAALGNDANFATTVNTNIGTKASLSGAIFTGSISGPSGNFTSLKVNNVDVSASGHTHSPSDITNFNSSVSGLLPVGTANYLSKFGTNGSGLSNSLVFDNGTNVGIGTTNPTSRLHVIGSGIFSSGIIVGDSSTNGYIYGPSGNANIQFNNSATNRIDITATNLFFSASTYLGGTTYANGTLTFPKTSTPTSIATQSNPNELRFYNGLWNGSSAYDGYNTLHSIASTSVSGASRFAVLMNNGDGTQGRTERLSVLSNGNVGIGTITPSGFLDVAGDVYVRGTGNNLGTVYFKSSASSDTALKVRADINGNLFLDAGSASVKVGNQDGAVDIQSANQPVTLGQSYDGSNVNQQVRIRTAGTERIRVTNSGLVGIGTTTPSGQLHVVGTGIFSSGIGVGTNSPLDLIHVSGSSANAQGIRLENADGYGGSILADNGALYFNSPTATAFRIQASKIRLGNGVSATAIELSNNGSISQDGNGGGLTFSGTTAQFSNGINVTNSGIFGSVGIGTTSPSGQLHVIGTGIFSSGVGIGTTTPTYDLDVRTNSTNAFYVTQGGGARYLSFGPTGFINNTTLAVSKTGWSNFASLEVNTVAPGRRGLLIEQVSSQTANAIETRDIASNVLSYINSSGGAYFANNVGIGTTNPQYKLDVNGNVNVSGVLSVSGVPLGEIIDDEVAGLLIAGSGMSLTYNDSANTLTIDSNATTSLSGGNGVSLDYNSSSDTLVVNTVNFIHPFLLAGM
jgi:hypothetical protein